jgi:hypothetical protein
MLNASCRFESATKRIREMNRDVAEVEDDDEEEKEGRALSWRGAVG